MKFKWYRLIPLACYFLFVLSFVVIIIGAFYHHATTTPPTYSYEIWVNGIHYYTNEYVVDQQGKLTFRSEDGYILEFYQPNNLIIAHKKDLLNVK
jgi:hypothetical protein